MDQNTYTVAAQTLTSKESAALQVESGLRGAAHPNGRVMQIGWSGWGVLACAAVLTVVVSYWAKFSIEADAATNPTVAPEVSVSAAAFEYFPDQYVNQAKDREEPFPTF